MNSDDSTRAGREAFRSMGVGMPARFYSPRCNTIGPSEGQRKWRLEMNQCAKCVASSKEKKVAV